MAWPSRHPWTRPSALVILVGLVYVPFLDNPLLWDDRKYMLESPFTKSWRNLPAAFTTERQRLGWDERPAYRPLATVTYFVDHALWGMRPAGRRLPNLLIHLATTALLYQVLRRLVDADGPAFWAALLFGLHPANSEVVLCVMFRHAALSGLALLAVVWLHLRGWRAAAAAALAAGLLSKETLVVAPAVICIVDRLRRERAPLRTAAPYVLVVAVYAGVRIWLLPPPLPDIRPAGMSPFTHTYLQVLNALASVPTLIWQAFWPARLSVDYVIPRASGWTDPRVAAAVGILLGLGVLIARRSRTLPLAAAGILWAAVATLPTMRWMPLAGTHEVAERYLYLPLMGASLAAAAVLSRAAARPRLRRAAAAVTALVAIAFGGRTYARGLDWRDPKRLYEDTLARFPGSYSARDGLARALLADGQYAQVRDQLLVAVRIDPWDFQARNNLALAHLAEREYVQARDQLLVVVRISPEDPRVWRNLARALIGLKDNTGAVRACQEALRLDANNATAYRLLAAAYARMGRPREAARASEMARRLGPAPASAITED